MRLAFIVLTGGQAVLQLRRVQDHSAAGTSFDADLARLGRLLDFASELVWEHSSTFESDEFDQLEDATFDVADNTSFAALLQESSLSCSSLEASSCRLDQYDAGIFMLPAANTSTNLLQSRPRSDDEDQEDEEEDDSSAAGAEDSGEEEKTADTLSKQVQTVLSSDDQDNLVHKMDREWEKLQKEVPELEANADTEDEAPEHDGEEDESSEQDEQESEEEETESLFSPEDNALLQGVDTPMGNATQGVALLALGGVKLTPLQRIMRVSNSVLKKMKMILTNSARNADQVMKSIDGAVAAVPAVRLVWKSYKQALTALYKSGKCMNTGNFMCGLNTLNAFFSKKATAARVKAFCAVARRGLRGSVKARKIRRCLKAGMQGAMLSAVGAGGPIRNLKRQAGVMDGRAKRAKAQARRAMLQARKKKGKARKNLLTKAAKLRVFARKSKMAAGLLRYKRKKTLAAKVGLLRLRKSMKNLRKVRKTMMKLLNRVKRMAGVRSQVTKLRATSRKATQMKRSISKLKKARGKLKLQISGAKKQCKALKRKAKVVRLRQKRRQATIRLLRKRVGKFAKGLRWRRGNLAQTQRKAKRTKAAWMKRRLSQKANSMKRTIARVAGRHKRAKNALARTKLAAKKARSRLTALVKRIRACRKNRRARRARLLKLNRQIKKKQGMLRRRGRMTKKLKSRVKYQTRAVAAYRKLIGARGMKPGAKLPGFKLAVNRLGKQKAGHFYKVYHPDGARDKGFIVPLSNRKTCMTVAGSNVVVSKCSDRNIRQKWYFDKWGRMISMATKTCVIFNTNTWNLSMGGCRQTAQCKFTADSLNRIHVFLRPRLCAAVSGTNVVMQNCVAGRKQSWDFPPTIR